MDDYKYKHTEGSKETDYPRLVRDKIPDINKKRWGLELDHKIAKDDEEYLRFLLKKLVEESEEAKESDSKEMAGEIADIYEVIDSIIKLLGLSKDEISKYQKAKREDNGAFDKRVLMLSKNMPE
jgi:predicted house-cleaning noncanonical NTP pyrophosphatase (MazG superfamily)